MAKQRIIFEIETDQINSQNFEQIKNKLAERLIKEAFWDKGNNTWHVKGEFDRHVKVSGGVSGLGVDPELIFEKEDFDFERTKNIKNLKNGLDNLKSEF